MNIASSIATDPRQGSQDIEGRRQPVPALGVIGVLLLIAVSSCSGSDSPTDASAGPPDRLISIGGDGQTSSSLGMALATDLRVRVVDAAGNHVPGALVRWRSDRHDASLEPAEAAADAQGVARTRWTLGNVAGDHAAWAVLPGVDSVRFGAHLVPSEIEVSPYPLILWPGDTVSLSVAFFDAQGEELMHEPVVWTSSSHQRIVPVGGGRIAAGSQEGLALLTGRTNGLSFQVSVTVGTVLRPVLLPVNHQVPDDLWAFLRIESCIDSIPLHPEEQREWRVPAALSHVPEWEYLVDRAGGGARTHFPSVATRPRVPPDGRLKTIVTPIHWEFSRGTWEGRAVPLSFSRAMNLGVTSAQSFIPYRVHPGQPDPRQLFSWPADAYPIPVYLDHYGSPEGLTAADSVTIWSYLRDMEARIGFDMFVPVQAEDVPTRRVVAIDERFETPEGDAIAIRMSNVQRPASGGSSRVFCEEEGCLVGGLSRGTIDMNKRIWLTGPSTTQHEMYHALGTGHTCMWPTIMHSNVLIVDGMGALCGRWKLEWGPSGEIAPDAGLTPFDTAIWLAFHKNLELLRSHPGAMAVWETVHGENLFVLAQEVDGFPTAASWNAARAAVPPAWSSVAPTGDGSMTGFCAVGEPGTGSRFPFGRGVVDQ